MRSHSTSLYTTHGKKTNIYKRQSLTLVRFLNGQYKINSIQLLYLTNNHYYSNKVFTYNKSEKLFLNSFKSRISSYISALSSNSFLFFFSQFQKLHFLSLSLVSERDVIVLTCSYYLWVESVRICSLFLPCLSYKTKAKYISKHNIIFYL